MKFKIGFSAEEKKENPAGEVQQETKAEVDNLIRDVLWEGLPESYDEISISSYRQKIYEYVYTRYKGVA